MSAQPLPNAACEICPPQCALGRREVLLQRAIATVTQIAERTLMGSGDDTVESQLMGLLQSKNMDDASEIAEHVAESMRMGAAYYLEGLEALLKAVRAKRQQLCATCTSPLELRGSANGQQFTVTICTSNEPDRPVADFQTAYISRTPQAPVVSEPDASL